MDVNQDFRLGLEPTQQPLLKVMVGRARMSFLSSRLSHKSAIFTELVSQESITGVYITQLYVSRRTGSGQVSSLRLEKNIVGFVTLLFGLEELCNQCGGDGPLTKCIF